jgi:hypothetical protein
MYCNDKGSDCGNVQWKFPPARHRKWSVNPNAKCMNGTKWKVTIEWGNP